MYDKAKKDEPCSEKEVKTVTVTVITKTEFDDGTVETETVEKVKKYPMLNNQELENSFFV